MLICIISPTIFTDYIKREFFKRRHSIHDIELDKKKYTKKDICHIHGSSIDVLKDKGLTIFSITHPSEIDPKISELIDYYVIKNNKKTLSEVYCDALRKYISVDINIITNLKDNQYVLYNNVNGDIEIESISHQYDQYCRSMLELDDNVHPIEKFRYKNIVVQSQSTDITMSSLYEYCNVINLTIRDNDKITTLCTMSIDYLTTLHIDNCKSLRKLPNLPNCINLICKDCSLAELPILPKKMDRLDVSHNKLTYITKLPKMDYCNLSHNNINLLPKIHCRDLDCSYNILTSLKLGRKVSFLLCNNNRLQDLNSRNVMILDCSYNNIVTLKGLSKTTKLVCNNNRIKKLPNSKYIKYINCSYNEGIEIGHHKNLTRLEVYYCNPIIVSSKLPKIIKIITEE